MYPYHYIAFFIKSSISKQFKFSQQKKVQIILSDPCFKTVKARNCNQELGDNCIVFENFAASIGNLMVAN